MNQINENEQMSVDSALKSCVFKGDVIGARFCLENGANPDIRCKDRFNNKTVSLLSRAMLSCNVIDSVNLLIEYGADVTAVNDDGKNLLHLVCERFSGNSGVYFLKYFISKGVYVNKQDEYNITPLHSAVSNRNAALINILLNNGADKELVDDSGNKPDECLYRFRGEDLRIKIILNPHWVANKICRRCIIKGESSDFCLNKSKIKRQRVIAKKDFCNYYLEHLMIREQMRSKDYIKKHPVLFGTNYEINDNKVMILNKRKLRRKFE